MKCSSWAVIHFQNREAASRGIEYCRGVEVLLHPRSGFVLAPLEGLSDLTIQGEIISSLKFNSLMMGPLKLLP